MMKKVLFHDGASTRASIGLLVLRMAVGVAFILHGWPKIQNPTGWMGLDAPVPGFAQALAAVAEFCGGIALILGVFTPAATVLLIGTMVVAVNFHMKQGHPFVAKGGPSYELAVGYLAASVALLFAGPGRLSLDALLCGDKSGTKSCPRPS